jgi:hypothetical protein
MNGTPNNRREPMALFVDVHPITPCSAHDSKRKIWKKQ